MSALSIGVVCTNPLRLKFNKKDSIFAINLSEDWDPRSAKKRIDRFLTSSRSEIALAYGDKVIRERFGGIDRVPTLFVFVQPRGPKQIHASDFELTRVIEKLR